MIRTQREDVQLRNEDDGTLTILKAPDESLCSPELLADIERVSNGNATYDAEAKLLVFHGGDGDVAYTVTDDQDFTTRALVMHRVHDSVNEDSE